MLVGLFWMARGGLAVVASATEIGSRKGGGAGGIRCVGSGISWEWGGGGVLIIHFSQVALRVIAYDVCFFWVRDWKTRGGRSLAPANREKKKQMEKKKEAILRE